MQTINRYFGTDGIRGKVGGQLINAHFALRLGYAAGIALASQPAASGRPTVLIGKDTRISGYMLESALEAGFSAAGVDVLLAGPMPTPAIAYLTRALRLSAGVVISASHNPYYDNGIKFFSAQGIKLSDALEQSIELALEQPIGCAHSESLGKAKRLNDAGGRYIEFCKNSFPSTLSLTGLKIVVDAAHGAAYEIAPLVFRELGAQVVAMGCQPDGLNINDKVGATHVDALVESVKLHQADFGIALDGDADRLVMVDRSGRVYNGDELLYVLVLDRLAQGPLAGVAGTLMTNFAFEKRMQALGVPFGRAAVGDRHVLEMMQQNNWLLGGEGSGHLIVMDRHTTGDGVIAALQILAAVLRAQKSLAQLLVDMPLAPQKLVNVNLQPGDNWQTNAKLIQAKLEIEQSLSGVGRVLIRASGTEPKLRLMVEANELAIAEQAIAHLMQSLSV